MAMASTLRARPRSITAWLGLVLVAALLSACGSAASGASVAPSASAGNGASGPPPEPSAAPSAGASAPTEATNAQAAAYFVGQENALLAGVRPREADAIGQAYWYDATKTAKGWRLVYTLGWGDCLAGCIQGHVFTYDVTTDGQVTLVDERGESIPADVVDQLRREAAAPVVSQGLSGRATAGPICPVEQPGDPACDPRPVAGAQLVVRGADGSEVARIATDANGAFALELPVGEYVLEAQPVEGLMGTPAPIPFRVEEGRAAVLDVSYDTGIR